MDLADRLGLLHLLDLESPFSVLGLGFWALVRVVALLVATITLHILQIIQINQFSRIFCIRHIRPSRGFGISDLFNDSMRKGWIPRFILHISLFDTISDLQNVAIS